MEVIKSPVLKVNESMKRKIWKSKEEETSEDGWNKFRYSNTRKHIIYKKIKIYFRYRNFQLNKIQYFQH